MSKQYVKDEADAMTEFPVCEVEECENLTRLRSKTRNEGFHRLCSKHRKRAETKKAKDDGRQCSIKGCDQPVCQSRAICRSHLYRLQKYGDPLAETPPREVREVLEICEAEGCERQTSRWPLRNGGFGRRRICIAHHDRRLRFGDFLLEVSIPAGWGELVRVAEERGLVDRSRVCPLPKNDAK